MFVGTLIANVVHQISYSDGYFQETGYVAGAIVAAAGLRLAWLDVGRTLPLSRRADFVSLAAWVIGFLLLVKITSRSIASLDSTMALYVGVSAAGVVVVVAWALVRPAPPSFGIRSTRTGSDPATGGGRPHHAALCLSDRAQSDLQRAAHDRPTSTRPWSLDSPPVAARPLAGRRRVRRQQ
jgi:hypothetical protein